MTIAQASRKCEQTSSSMALGLIWQSMTNVVAGALHFARERLSLRMSSAAIFGVSINPSG